jgi:uncharacterized protein YbcI
MPEREASRTRTAEARVQRAGPAASDISTGMVQLMARYSGRGPTRARTTVNTNLVAVVLEDTLTKAEQNLVAAREMDSVAQMRRTFQAMMREEAIALVERGTGRTVRAFLGDIDPDNNIAGYLFILDPIPESGLAFTADVESD